MALVKAETAQGFSRLPALRQLGLMIGLAASVAIGVAVVLWSQEPTYSLLYGELSKKDSSEVLDALQQAQIPYKVEAGSGMVMVPADKVHEARMKLAGQGLPNSSSVGFELLQKEQELGTSQFMEKARYQHALEVELARSISSLRNVKSTRVHLAVPERSVFVRKQKPPSASVVVDLYSGRNLEQRQVGSIVHMVASSVPNLNPEKVTLVDQDGNLLSKSLGDADMAMTSSQFEFTRKLEQSYRERIEDLLSPVVGQGRVRAQVVADLNFTKTESTRESYDPDSRVLRSEQISEEQSASSKGPEGVPGAASNRPGGAQDTVQGAEKQALDSKSTQATRNYELDKTVSHTRTSGGKINKLSVAVVVDDRQTVNDEGEAVRTPLTDKELSEMTKLVKDAVGFDSARGDTVSVINSAFQRPDAPEPLPEPPLWEQPWVQDLVKQALGAVAVLLLVFGVLRPVLRSLAEKGAQVPVAAGAAQTGQNVGEDQLTLSQGDQQGQLPGPGQQNSQYDNQLNTAKNLATQDPARVAQVVKNWVAADG